MGKIIVITQTNGLREEGDMVFIGDDSTIVANFRLATKFEEKLFKYNYRNINDFELHIPKEFKIVIEIGKPLFEGYSKKRHSIIGFFKDIGIYRTIKSSTIYKFIGLSHIHTMGFDVYPDNLEANLFLDLDSFIDFVARNWVGIKPKGFDINNFCIYIDSRAEWKKYVRECRVSGIPCRNSYFPNNYYGVENGKQQNNIFKFSILLDSVQQLSDYLIKRSVDKVFGKDGISTDTAFPCGEISLIPAITGTILTEDITGSSGAVWADPIVTVDYIEKQIEKNKNKLITSKITKNGKYLKKTSKVRRPAKSKGQRPTKGLQLHQRAERITGEIRSFRNPQAAGVRKTVIAETYVEGNAISSRDLR